MQYSPNITKIYFNSATEFKIVNRGDIPTPALVAFLNGIERRWKKGTGASVLLVENGNFTFNTGSLGRKALNSCIKLLIRDLMPHSY